jgi:hypothetical protein
MDALASRTAGRLLALLSAEPDCATGQADHPALSWRRAGLMDISGRSDGSGLVCPVPLAAAADGALLALRAIAPKSAVLPECGALLLGERARLMGLVRGGRVSPNGSCRLIETRDGRIALNLARSDDWDLMPILLGVEQAGDWIDVERAAARKTTAELVETGIEFGLPVARDELVAPPVSPFAIEDGDASGSAPARPPRVLDFASLWAGPLAASLLGMLGADVVKVESVHRLDGARHGDGGFFDLLNSGKRSVAIDFADPDQHRRLLALVDSADIVIEGSRPRALRRLGILREDFVARGGIWTAITAHDDPDRVGFGDDAAVAAGVAAHMARVWGAPMFAGDAIADPLTGLHAALATWQMWRQRRSGLVRLSLAGTVAFACGEDAAAAEEVYRWQAMADEDRAPLYPLRMAPRAARAAGADNDLLR